MPTSPPLVEKSYLNLCTVGAEVKMMLHRSTINSSPMGTHFFVPKWHEAE